MKYWPFIFIYVLLIVAHASAQTSNYIRYTTEDGLPSNYVYGVVEDNNGYIWAYTENGIAKFDGYHFKHFSTVEGLPYNDIPYAHKDGQGRIWLWTYRNNIAYIEYDSLVVLDERFGTPVSIHQVSEGALHISTTTGYWRTTPTDTLIYLDSLQIDKTVFETYQQYYKLDTTIYLDYHIDLPKTIYIREAKVCDYHHQQVDVYDPKYFEKGFRYIAIAPNEYLYMFSNDNIVFHKKNNLLSEFDIETIEDERYIALYPTPDGQAFFCRLNQYKLQYVNMRNGKRWILDLKKEAATTSGKRALRHDVKVHFIDNLANVTYPNGLRIYNYAGELEATLPFSSIDAHYDILNSFLDSRGNVWVGSRNGGLFMLPATRQNAQLIAVEDRQTIAFDNLMVTPNHEILAGSYFSSIYEISNGRLELIWQPPVDTRFRGGRVLHEKSILLTLSNHEAYYLEKDQQDWKATSFSSRHHMGKEIDYTLSSYVASEMNNVFQVSFDIVSMQLFGIYAGRYLITIQYDENYEILAFEYYDTKYSCSAIAVKKEGKGAWLAGEQKIYSFENGKRKLIHHLPFMERVGVLYETYGYIWIGTEGNGLWYLNTTTDSLHKVADYQHIYQIRQGFEEETLLLATNEGLVVWRIDQKGGYLVEHYTTNDGLPLNEIRDVAAIDNRYLYVATYEGVWRLDREFKNNHGALVKDFTYTSLWVNQQLIPLDTALLLNYDRNDVSIHYQLRHYASDQKIKYFTRLMPLEEDWREGTALSRTFLNLAPGKYRFIAKAEDVYGKTISLAPLSITIRPAWWQRLWVQLIAILLIMILLGMMIVQRDRRRSQQLQRDKQFNQRMANLELSALRAQMNPHFVFNALGAIQYFIQLNEVEAADTYLTRFAKLMRSYLDSSRERLIPLSKEIALLKLYTQLEELRFEGQFTTSIITKGKLDVDAHYIPSMLLQPLVENAIIHGLNERRDGNGKLIISLDESANGLRCEIIDNGIGRKQAAMRKRHGHRSRGMKLIDERIATLKASGIAAIGIQSIDAFPEDTAFPGTQVILEIQITEDEDN